jgi:hypothetical protein
LDTWNRAKLSYDLPSTKREAAIVFLNGDTTAIDWSDADVAFAHATCFDDKLMSQVVTCAERMKPGSFFISVTKRYDHF